MVELSVQESSGKGHENQNQMVLNKIVKVHITPETERPCIKSSRYMRDDRMEKREGLTKMYREQEVYPTVPTNTTFEISIK